MITTQTTPNLYGSNMVEQRETRGNIIKPTNFIRGGLNNARR